MIIAFEGVDNVGKSTVSEIVYKYLKEEFPCQLIQESKDPVICALKDNSNLDLKKYNPAFIFWMVRLSYQDKLKNNIITILDRYNDSTAVYANLNKELLEFNYNTKIFKQPNITFILTSSIKEIKKRFKNTDLFDRNNDEEILKRKLKYIEISENNPNKFLINTTGNSITKVVDCCLEIISNSVLTFFIKEEKHERNI